MNKVEEILACPNNGIFRDEVLKPLKDKPKKI